MLSNLTDTDYQGWLPLASQNGSQGDRRYYDIFISTFLGCLNVLLGTFIPFVVKCTEAVLSVPLSLGLYLQCAPDFFQQSGGSVAV